MRGGTRTAGLINPLPGALHHYEGALASVLQALGWHVESQITSGIERDHNPGRSRVWIALRTLRGRRWSVAGPRIVLWPAFGGLEPWTWRGRRGSPVLLVIHDPRTLVGGVATGALARRLGAWGAERVMPLVHTAEAGALLEADGWPRARIVDHPVLPPGPGSKRAPGGPVRVLGQYKEARDVDLLEGLAREPSVAERSLEIVGRGWPAVTGWKVTSTFVDEEVFTELIASAGCVLIPYRELHQSGVAVRALEQRVPVVGSDHPQLRALLGSQWPGLAAGRPAAWAQALEDVLTADWSDVLAERHQLAWDRCLVSWSAALTAAVERAADLPGPSLP